MRETIQKLRHKRAALTAILIFLVAYPLFLLAWLHVKDDYASAVTLVAAKLLTLAKDVSYEGMRQVKDTIQVTFSPLSWRDLLVDVQFRTSSFTFNAPLTFALMATFWPFLRRKAHAYAESLLILLGVHILYVFSLEAKMLTQILIQQGAERGSAVRLFCTQFLWSFTDNMVIRFEPFLIGFYMFIRFGK